MKRKIRYEQYKEENRETFQKAWFQWQSEKTDSHRLVRRRPRHPNEIKLLDRLAYDCWNGAIERGELEQIGPRRYRVHIRGLSARD